MHWDHPNVLFLLWILPGVAALLVVAHNKRVAAAGRFADPAMVARLMPALKSPRPWVKGSLILLGLTCLIVAGARPRFGVYFERVQRQGADVFFLVDVSRSMLAEDVAPSRLGRARSDVLDVLQRLEGDRVGLVAFAGKAVVKMPLTTDHGFFRMVLDELSPNSAPRGGSLIGDAIRKALESMEERRDRDQVLILITDGEDHDSFPVDAAKQAAERGVKIFTVGLGDSGEGARIPLRSEDGTLTYMKHEGREVWSRMDEETLKEVALATEGAYIPARTLSYDLGEVYAKYLAGLTRGEVESEKRKRFRERFQLFVCLGIFFLLLDMLVPGYPRRAEITEHVEVES